MDSRTCLYSANVSECSTICEGFDGVKRTDIGVVAVKARIVGHWEEGMWWEYKGSKSHPLDGTTWHQKLGGEKLCDYRTLWVQVEAFIF